MSVIPHFAGFRPSISPKAHQGLDPSHGSPLEAAENRAPGASNAAEIRAPPGLRPLRLEGRLQRYRGGPHGQPRAADAFGAGGGGGKGARDILLGECVCWKVWPGGWKVWLALFSFLVGRPDLMCSVLGLVAGLKLIGQ